MFIKFILNKPYKHIIRGVFTMKIVLLKDSEKIKEGLRSLTKEFIGEYPFYSTWIHKNEATFSNGS